MALARKDIDRLPAHARRSVEQQLGANAPKASKYHNVRTVVDGVTYASRAEARFADDLEASRMAGLIRGWCRQGEFVLEGGVRYKFDFGIIERSGVVTFVDVKGVRTREYVIKRKQVMARHGTNIKEVDAQ